MPLSIGIVGLPNVGKSTLFNALTKLRAPAANFPFTTVDPNVGIVTVPDARLMKLSEMSASRKTVPTAIEFVDIAGLVKGAHAGEGLGNKFLANIRETDAIAHVVRFFGGDVLHVDGGVDPVRDAETIETELTLADLETAGKMLERARSDAKSGRKEALERAAAMEKLHAHLAAGDPARTALLSEKEKDALADVKLLTHKPAVYIANLDEEQIRDPAAAVGAFAEKFSPVVPVCIKVEQELSELADGEKAEFLAAYNLKHSGLEDIVTSAYSALDLITFFTTGEDETRAWTVRSGALAPEAAGRIHTDFEQGFIRAETVHTDDLLACGSYAAAREKGKLRDEGKEYEVKDGDVFVFKFAN